MMKMNLKKSTAIWALVAVAVVLAVVVVALQLRGRKSAETGGEEAKTLRGGMTYDQAVAQYGTLGNNYRFQFADCRGTPPILQIKKGVKFMIDNRDDSAHTFKVGAQSLRIGAWDFAILTASTLGQQNVTCDGGPNAILNVQK